MIPALTQPLAIILGTTASGKTDLALQLALANPGAQIICADAFQVYRGLDIGTAKLPESERQGIVHHLLDIKSSRDHFSVGEFLRCCDAIIQNASGPLIFCGGTLYYLYAFLHQYAFETGPRDLVISDQLARDAEKFGSEAMWERLSEQDPVYAQKVHPHDVKRVLRALEIIASTGRIPSAVFQASASRTDVQLIGIERPLEMMHDRINQRVLDMMDAGFVEEVQGLLAQGWGPKDQSYQALGYADVHQYLTGDLRKSEMVECIQLKTRQFAKRQRTWLRRFEQVDWI